MMSLPIIVVVGALGAQGAGVVSVYTSPANSTKYHVRALTSNTSSDVAEALAAKSNVSVVAVDLHSLDSVLSAFKDASFIFANTIFNPETFTAQGPMATQAREEQQGMNIVRAASETPSLRHLIWSTLPDTVTISDGKWDIPHFMGKVPAEKYARSDESGLATKTTYLHVGFYGSNVTREPYRLVPVAGAKKHILMMPCSPDALIPLIGDERVNVGLLARAIFEQPEKTIGRAVLGAAEILSCRDYTNTLKKSFQRQGKELDLVYVECTLKAWENLWGPVGTELGLMMTFFRDVEYGGFKAKTGSLPVLTPEDLGVGGELRSTEDCLTEMGWQAFVKVDV